MSKAEGLLDMIDALTSKAPGLKEREILMEIAAELGQPKAKPQPKHGQRLPLKKEKAGEYMKALKEMGWKHEKTLFDRDDMPHHFFTKGKDVLEFWAHMYMKVRKDIPKG